MMKIISILFLIIISKNVYANSFIVLEGFWFECEYSGKTTPPPDNCKMLDNDGFQFKNNQALHIRNISSKEVKCKKNKVGQCFRSSEKSINIAIGRSDKVKFIESNLIISFLGCNQKFKLSNKKNYVEAVPDKKRCFWAGNKHFFLKRYFGKVNFSKD